MRSKIQFLEERLNDKKEALLEKELVLEEVTTLSEKLRAQVTAAFICAVPKIYVFH